MAIKNVVQAVFTFFTTKAPNYGLFPNIGDLPAHFVRLQDMSADDQYYYKQISFEEIQAYLRDMETTNGGTSISVTVLGDVPGLPAQINYLPA